MVQKQRTLRLRLVCFGEDIHAVGLEVIRYSLAVHCAKLNEQGRTEIITQAGNTLSKATLFVQTNWLWIL